MPAATNGGYQLSAISWSRCPFVGGGLRPLTAAISYQLSAISYRLSAGLDARS
ncbi:MAG TPA: hypothetical protein VFI39_03190 [Gemmatimonadales bacterium]|nr:hypothetical protein [Gemmatimonadales bacterium]